MNKINIILSFIFNIVLVLSITACAMFFNRIGLLWWYLLPAIGAFFTFITSVGGRE